MVQQVNLHPNTGSLSRAAYRAIPFGVAIVGISIISGTSYLFASRWDAESEPMQEKKSVQAAEVQRLEAQLLTLKPKDTTGKPKDTKGKPKDTKGKAKDTKGEPLPSDTLKEQQLALSQKKRLLNQLQVGLYSEGERYSDRLQWVARNVPALAWVDQIALDSEYFEIKGFTREPAELSPWVKRLAESPRMLLQGIGNVEVSDTPVAQATADPGVWSFRLVSALAPPSIISAGAKP